MWKYLRKRLAVRSYRTKLATKLRRLYGRERFYTPAQVRRGATESGVSFDHLCFAFAMFCDRDTFDADHAERGEPCDYHAMRNDIGHWLFDGSTDFDATSCDMYVDQPGGFGHHDSGHHHDVGHLDAGHHDFGGHDFGGHDFGGHDGGGFDGGGHD